MNSWTSTSAKVWASWLDIRISFHPHGEIMMRIYLFPASAVGSGPSTSMVIYMFHGRAHIVYIQWGFDFLVRSSLLSTYITVSTPLLDIMPTLDPVESLHDTAQGLDSPQVTSCWCIVQLLQISMPLGVSLLYNGIPRGCLPEPI